jgi:hypothetical protein
MPPSITPAQRDALYEQVLDRLTGISDVQLAVETGDLEAADRLSLEFADYLRLLHDDLGWEEEANGAVELRSPPDVLRRSLGRLQERAEIEDREEEEERAEARRLQARNRMVRETCSRLLAELPG